MKDVTTVKVSKKNHDTVCALANDTGLGVTELLDRLIEEGLNNAKRVGKAVASNDELMTKLKDKTEAAVEITEKDLLAGEQETEDEGSKGEDPEEDSKDEGSNVLALIGLGILGLAFLASRARSL